MGVMTRLSLPTILALLSSVNFSLYAIEDAKGWMSLEGDVKIETGASVLLPPSDPEGVGYYELDAPSEDGRDVFSFYLKAPASPLEEAATNIDVDGAEIAIVDEDGQHRIYLFDPAGEGEWRATDYLIAANGFATWIKISIVRDNSSSTWDLYADNDLIAKEFQFVDKEGVQDIALLFGDKKFPTQLEGFTEERVVNSFGSEFHSGVYGVDTLGYYLEDIISKYGDRMVGHRNQLMPLSQVLDEMFSILGEGFLNQSDGHIQFVDNEYGSDQNAGYSPEVTEKDGPKATMKAAFEEALAGSFIVVFEGTGVYPETTPSSAEKRVTWLHLGDGLQGSESSIRDAIRESRVRFTKKRINALQRLGIMNIIKNTI